MVAPPSEIMHMLLQETNAVGFNTPGAASSAADFGEVWEGCWEGFGKALGGPWRFLGHF